MVRHKTSERRSRKLLTCRHPGTVILWWQYHFPKPGETWTSARRKDVPAMQVLYSLGFWFVVALVLWAFVFNHR